MLVMSSILFVIGCILCIIGAIKIGKKNYDINVSLQPDVENIIKKSVDDFLATHCEIDKPCQHVWETIKSGKVNRDNGSSGFYYDLQCKKCGEITTRET